MEPNQMEQLLKQLLTMNNASRSHGEAALTELEKNPDAYLTSLVSVGAVLAAIDARRSFARRLCRRCGTSPAF